MTRLESMLAATPYTGYLYAYPHKTAYRPLSPPVSLAPLWDGEDKRALFLYLHIPFCEMRCGFCNLFTAAGPKADGVQRYLATLLRDARQVKAALGEVAFARVAVGGGTPTLLDVESLARLLDLAEGVMGAKLPLVPVSVESSPETVDAAKLRLLRERGVDRVSLGVQSFLEAEVAAVKRPQKTAEVEAALDLIRAEGFPTLNIDLIYGMEGQTEASFATSLRQALRWRPEEIYLYPLYVRPLTFLGKSSQLWDDHRLKLYRAGRALLLSEGYTQVSMRMFRAAHAPSHGGPVYRCQEDGMVGLGCGSRSYTKALHYSSEYAVNARAVRGIIDAYIDRPDASFTAAHYGIRLSEDEQRRRFAILSLLAEGLDAREYRGRFGAAVFEDFPQLLQLSELGLACLEGERLVLTPAGVERSDTLGPWLHSAPVEALMQAYEAR